ncbi:FtsX-like permease family protein [Nonomuraea jiangxiensis]|uniref:Putative ABC transport system permease protein n=1 Tax=Nonomuraea jiangxiensis TaxID=633440 RepID=A0A1G9BIE5_9ACTN|nr:ABC transporter permease [Nonomuraea jiangxiensis]SDK38625.1 putative ABC transport system permease protein [Nonomuraea jiangxiensis]
MLSHRDNRRSADDSRPPRGSTERPTRGTGLRLGLATLRERWSALAGSAVALVLGVAIVTVTSLAWFSGVPRLPDRLAGASVLVASPAIERADGDFTPDRPWSPGQAASFVRRLGELDGVARAVPERSFYAQAVVGGAPAEADRGHAWSTTALGPYGLVTGRAPQHTGEAVVDRSLGAAPGTRITVLTAEGPAPYTVTGTTDGPGVYLSDAEAETLAGGVRVIGLVTEPGADVSAVESAARAVTGGQGRVFAGDERTALEPLEEARVRWIGTQVLTAMSALSAFVSIFVVASTFAFAVAQRRHELGLLRAVGATPRQIRGIVYGEALAVGVVAAGAGVLLGALLAPVLGDALVTAGFEPPGFEVRPLPLPLVGAFVLGVLVALVGVWSAARRAGRVGPLEALREAAVDDRPMPRSRWIAGGLSTATGLACAVVTAGAEGGDLFNLALYTAMALIIGLALLAPAIVPPVARGVTWPLGRLRGATGLLVRESTLTAVRRTASTATPVLVTVGFAVLITGMVQTTAGVYSAARATSLRAHGMVIPSGTPGLSDAAVTASGGAAMLPTALYQDDDRTLPAAGITPRLLAMGRGSLDVVSGSLDSLAPDGAAIVPWVAESRGWKPGDRVKAIFEDGRATTLTIAAVVADAPTSVLLPYDLVREHDPSALAEEAYLGQGGPATVRPGVGARAVDMTTYAAESADEEDRLVWIFTLLLVIVSAGYTAVSIANTQMMAAAGRRRDLAVLRLSGATRRQVVRALSTESAMVVALGTALGLLVALPALLGMRSGLAATLGMDVVLVVPWPLIAGLVIACLLVASGAAVLTARQAVRGPAGSPRDENLPTTG